MFSHKDLFCYGGTNILIVTHLLTDPSNSYSIPVWELFAKNTRSNFSSVICLEAIQRL